MTYNYKFEIKSDLSTVNKTVKNIIEDLSPCIDDKKLLFNIRLVLTELITNGIIHGNKKNENKKVFLEIVYGDEKILLRIKDQGSGIDGGYKVKSDKLDRSGRGLFLVDQLCDNFKIKGCEVYCTFNI